MALEHFQDRRTLLGLPQSIKEPRNHGMLCRDCSTRSMRGIGTSDVEVTVLVESATHIVDKVDNVCLEI